MDKDYLTLKRASFEDYPRTGTGFGGTVVAMRSAAWGKQLANCTLCVLAVKMRRRLTALAGATDKRIYWVR
jgi:hypothetical protein